MEKMRTILIYLLGISSAILVARQLARAERGTGTRILSGAAVCEASCTPCDDPAE